MAKSPKPRGTFKQIALETRIVTVEELAADQQLRNAKESKIQVDPLPPNLAARLEVVRGRSSGLIYSIEKPLVIIGRVDDVADVVINDTAASRHHAAIAYYAKHFSIYDMGSSNGTFVGKKQVTHQRLEHGSEVRIGKTVIIFWVSNPCRGGHT